MKHWKNWLLPLLTLLTVVGAALVPQQLSLLRDTRMAGQVHTQSLTGGNNFSLWTPSLPERLELLGKYLAADDTVSTMIQSLYGKDLAGAESQTLALLKELADAGAFSADFLPNAISLSNAYRLDLWIPGTLGGSSFDVVYLEDTGIGWDMEAYLDRESGKIVNVLLFSAWGGEFMSLPQDLGQYFFQSWDTAPRLFGAGEFEAVYTVEGTGLAYLVNADDSGFLITLHTRADIGLEPTLPGPTDAEFIDSGSHNAAAVK